MIVLKACIEEEDGSPLKKGSELIRTLFISKNYKTQKEAELSVSEESPIYRVKEPFSQT